ncbi:MAG: polymer-forming cytoskeletal protein [Phycisphaeraceae bacterium]|nr:polymer-forming cytoskeletal protein [Phycisphaeraceae bacterium]
MGEGTRNKTVLGPDCKISGELTLDNDAVIMGQFTGTLRVTGMLELTESSQINGTIIAGTLRMAGKAEADVVAEQGCELMPGAQLLGQLYTSHLNVIEGAVFQGDVCVGPKAIAAAAEALGQEEEEIEEEQQYSSSMMMTQQEEPAEEEEPQITTNPGSVNAVLQRRRAKVLQARRPATNSNR